MSAKTVNGVVMGVIIGGLLGMMYGKEIGTPEGQFDWKIKIERILAEHAAAPDRHKLALLSLIRSGGDITEEDLVKNRAYANKVIKENRPKSYEHDVKLELERWSELVVIYNGD